MPTAITTAQAAPISRKTRRPTMSDRDPAAPSPPDASPPRSSSATSASSLLFGDEVWPHEFVVFVIEDVAVLDVPGRVGRIEREQILPRGGAVGRHALRRPPDGEPRDLTRPHLDR